MVEPVVAALFEALICTVGQGELKIRIAIGICAGIGFQAFDLAHLDRDVFDFRSIDVLVGYQAVAFRIDVGKVELERTGQHSHHVVAVYACRVARSGR